jgi:hypothetical protein
VGYVVAYYPYMNADAQQAVEHRRQGVASYSECLDWAWSQQSATVKITLL